MFVDLPLGHTAGPPNDPATQQYIVDQALAIGATMNRPTDGRGVIADLPLRWFESDWKASPLSWSRRAQSSGRSGVDAGDTRTSRSAEPQWQSDDDRRAAEAG